MKGLGLAVSTVKTICNIKDKTIASAQASTPLSAMKVTHHWSDVMEYMERLLNTWIED